MSESHYKKSSYNTLYRFVSYYYQIKSIFDLNPNSVLEIGIGSNLVSNYLKQNNISVKTCDVKKELSPDIICDIRGISLPDNSYDLVCAYEVLEHIPFNDFIKSIKEMKRVSKKHVIFSVPYSSPYIHLLFTLPYLSRVIKKKYLGLLFRLPIYKKHKFNGEHYWELGKRGYPIKRIRQIIKSCDLRINKEFSPLFNKNHYFFILEKN
jgi:ubiquinone/menaquinone biosynthesis C-methylase UbiE